MNEKWLPKFPKQSKCCRQKNLESEGVGSDSDASNSDFHEIITSSSDAETIASSDEDDTNLLEAILGSTFLCDPSLLK